MGQSKGGGSILTDPKVLGSNTAFLSLHCLENSKLHPNLEFSSETI